MCFITLHGFIIISWHHINPNPNNQSYHCVTKILCSVFGGLVGVWYIANCCHLVGHSIPLGTSSSSNVWMINWKPCAQRLWIPEISFCYRVTRSYMMLRSTVTSVLDFVGISTIFSWCWTFGLAFAPFDRKPFARRTVTNPQRMIHSLDEFLSSRSAEFYHHKIHSLQKR